MPIGDLLAQITGEGPSPQPSTTAPLKRKADGELSQPAGKVLKKVQVQRESPQVISRIKTDPKVGTPTSNPKSEVSGPSKSRLDPQAPANGNTRMPSSLPGPTKPPKKGSYAEIMARGKAAQATMGQIGKIQHKPIERGLSKKEKQDGRGHEGHTHDDSGGKKTTNGSRPMRPNGSNAREGKDKMSKKLSTPIEQRKIKKAATATTGYSGTARPIISSHKASISATQGRHGNMGNKDHHMSTQSSRRYTYASEEEDAEEDYDSDASSDMEAAAFEVDEEEEYALRIARHEDAEALREENQHRREKEEKRRKLFELARARR